MAMRKLWRMCSRFISSPINVFLTFLVLLYVINHWSRASVSDGNTRQGKAVDSKARGAMSDNSEQSAGSILHYVEELKQLKPLVVEEDEFLQEYDRQCEYVPDPDDSPKKMPLCPCVPKILYGKLPVPVESPSWDRVLASQTDLFPGGEWKPRDCLARQRVAVILPYRDREDHLRLLLFHTVNIFKRHLQHFRIYLVEQTAGGRYNKALLMNAAFLEARKTWDFDCVIFHDVDMLVEDDRALYACAEAPRHIGAYVDKFRYKLTYPELFGGAVAMKATTFQAVNGYSNSYFGWGGEDDDMYFRLQAKGFSVERYPAHIARFQMVPHSTDRGNPVNEERQRSVDDMTSQIESDGLNSVSYIVHNTSRSLLYTHILVQPACPLQVKPYMGRSMDAGVENAILDLELCRTKCAHDNMCRAVTFELNTNNCVIHSKLQDPVPEPNFLYFMKDCSDIRKDL